MVANANVVSLYYTGTDLFHRLGLYGSEYVRF